MPLPATPKMGLVLPTLGGDTDVWDDLWNAAGLLIDGHSHIVGEGVQIPAEGTYFDTDLTFHASAGIQDLAFVKFQQVATSWVNTLNRTLFVNSADNELYYRTAAGTNIKITSGAGLNMSLVGGIYGDYSATAAKIYYEDAGKRYKMLQSGPAPDFWASVDCGDLKLYEKASGIANAVTVKSPAALAAGYNVTFGGALPGSTQAVQISSAGVLSYSNTFANLLTANAGITLASNQNITLSGTGVVKHGDYEENHDVPDHTSLSAAWNVTDHDVLTSGGSGSAYYDLRVRPGRRLKSVRCRVFGTGAANFTIEVTRTTNGAGGPVPVSTSDTHVPAAAWATRTFDFADFTVAADETVTVRLLMAATGMGCHNLVAVWDRP